MLFWQKLKLTNNNQKGLIFGRVCIYRPTGAKNLVEISDEQGFEV